MKIEVKNVTKKFKDETVLNNINIIFEEGKIYGLYGTNGAGKSVLLKLIAGFLVPNNGEILYDGVNLNNKLSFPDNLRALIEKPSFFPDLTGFENLKMLAKIQNKIDDQKILNTFELVNLTTEKDKKYGKYSLGMKQKLGIAQVLMEDPNVLILDEPFNGIERESVEKILNIILQEKQKGKTIIISSHIKDDLKRICDEIFLFENGNLIGVKSNAEL